MNKFFLLILIKLFCFVNIYSQNIGYISIESGFNLSKFNFKDSETKSSFEMDDYYPSPNQRVLLGFDIYKNFDFLLSAGYNKYKIIGKSIDIYNSRLSYDLNYISLSSGIGYEFTLTDRTKIMLNGDLTFNNFISGYQDVGSSTFNLENYNFQKNSFGYKYGCALSYDILTNLSVYLKYNLSEFFNMNDNTLIYNISSHIYSIGIQFCPFNEYEIYNNKL